MDDAEFAFFRVMLFTDKVGCVFGVGDGDVAAGHDAVVLVFEGFLVAVSAVIGGYERRVGALCRHPRAPCGSATSGVEQVYAFFPDQFFDEGCIFIDFERVFCGDRVFDDFAASINDILFQSSAFCQDKCPCPCFCKGACYFDC